MLRQARGLPLRRLLGQQRRRLSSSSPLHLHAVDSIGARLSRMVFVKLYEFFAVSFEHRRRVIRITRPCARKSGFPSSLRLAQPRRHLVPDYFVYSATAGVGIFYLAFFCACDRHGGLICWSPSVTASGCASSLARSVLATPVRAHRPRCVPEPGKLEHVSPDGLTASTSTSLPLRLP